MKASDILKYLLRKAVLVLVVVTAFALWSIALAVMILPMAVYIGVVLPILWLCRVKWDGDVVIRFISYWLLDWTFWQVDKVIRWANKE